MPKKILVIDDEPNIIKMVRSRLEANDYEVITACDGEEGLKKVQDERPDLVIVDILMPKMDGYTFVKNVKKRAKNLPIVILTAKTGMSALFEIEGVNDYVIKPFKAEDLLETIKKKLEGSK